MRRETKKNTYSPSHRLAVSLSHSLTADLRKAPMIKIVIDAKNKSFDVIELGEHSVDLNKIRSDIRRIVENSKTVEDIYTELGYWQFELSDNIQEQIIIDIKEEEDE